MIMTREINMPSITKLKPQEVSVIIGGLSYMTYLEIAGSIATTVIVGKSLKPHHRHELQDRNIFTILQTARTVIGATKTFCIIKASHYLGSKLDQWLSRE